MNAEARARKIADDCQQAGCDPKIKDKHRHLFVKHHWHCHPSPEFTLWFENDRYCVQSDVDLFAAWNTQYFRDLFAEAKSMGWDPDFSEKPVELTREQIAAVRDRQLHKFRELKKYLSQIGREMPKPLPTDYDQEAHQCSP